MARKPLFEGKGGPVMAITWPFHDVRALQKAQVLLRSLGYDTWIHKRTDYDCHELIIGWPDNANKPLQLPLTTHTTSKDN